MYNIMEKKIYNNSSKNKIDMSSYSEGIYFVKINNSTFKIVKK
jgi:hypothetical protein